MPTDHRAALAAIKRFDQLIVFLRDEMDWPIVSEDFEELTFEYTPEELGIDVRNAAKIQEIKRLRPLATNQPWGVFFIKFEPKRLPVVALRSILGRVALKKRASANSAERQVWAAEDLLFISNYGEGDVRQINFAHFATPAGSRDLPTLKVLGWDDRDTVLHLDHVARELTENLAWPKDEDDVDSWRKQWRSAFTLRHQEAVTTSRELSVRLAGLARAIRIRIRAVLSFETAGGPVTKLMKAFQKTLVHDLDADGFADMYAQTIAYGLLSARIADPHKKTTDDFSSHMRTNPFLRDLMETFLQIGGRRGNQKQSEIDFDELGVAEVVELLDNANMEAVMRDFGDRNPREDPVIHFYEWFLKEYDADKRMQRGVFYTPRPVVTYIVRSVDKLLCTEFGLADGLADTTTWGEMARRHKNLKIPEGVSPNQDFIQILDPAAGTGTFLIEAIDVIHDTLLKKWGAQGCRDTEIAALWNEYVRRHLLPRLHGYELLMAPYAIAHLKIGLKLYGTGYRFQSDERARVFLTNALEPAGSRQMTLDFLPALAHEARAVNKVKNGQRFTVVVGNPPYSGHSANKGSWIRDLLRGRAHQGRVENYFEVDGSPLNERNPKWLNDDYVKFIRLAHWQIERTGQGVIGFITNHSYLDNPTFRGMRESLIATLPVAYLLDLHGNAKKKERAPDGGKDENVFDIQQGVAVGLFTCPANDPSPTRPAYKHANPWGVREQTAGVGKYDRLASDDAGRMQWNELPLKPPLSLFVPRDEALHEEYESGWLIRDVFPLNGVGMTTARDHIVVDFESAPIVERATTFRDSTATDAHLCAELDIPLKKGWNIAKARELIRNEDDLEGLLEPVLYRPFDVRLIFYHDSLVWRTVRRVMQHMLAGDNIGLITTRQCQSNWSVMATKTIIAHKALAAYDINSLFPLWIYSADSLSGAVNRRESNLDPKFTQTFASAISLHFIREGNTDLANTFGPEDIFNYLYAVLHSPKYRRRYADFLKSDFPRVPLPGDRALFADLSRLGARLVRLHLMKAESTDASATLPVPGSNQVERIRYTPPLGSLPGRVWINGAQYFNGVDPKTYTFAVGGYRPAEKWLKDRKGRRLSTDDIAHYRKIVAALAETCLRMAEVDEIIEAHGGWPAAFQTGKDKSAAMEVVPFRPPTVEPKTEERYVTCVPLIPLRAAAGDFGAPQYLEEDGSFEWVAVESRHRLRAGMFVAQVVGKSMEPDIPDGAYCLFRSPVEGTRQGKTVLVQLRDALDPETGERYTVKRYTSEKVAIDHAWRHAHITLQPVNPDYDPIVLTSADENALHVVAEFLEVLG